MGTDNSFWGWLIQISVAGSVVLLPAGRRGLLPIYPTFIFISQTDMTKSPFFTETSKQSFAKFGRSDAHGKKAERALHVALPQENLDQAILGYAALAPDRRL